MTTRSLSPPSSTTPLVDRTESSATTGATIDTTSSSSVIDGSFRSQCSSDSQSVATKQLQQQNELLWKSIEGKLYGRELEKHTLLDAFDRYMWGWREGGGGVRSSNPTPPPHDDDDDKRTTQRRLLGMVIVTGASGSGKTQLARIIQDRMMHTNDDDMYDNDGWIHTGKNDEDDDDDDNVSDESTVVAGPRPSTILNEDDHSEDINTSDDHLSSSSESRIQYSFFLEGKCDQIRKSEPLEPFAKALTQLASHIIDIIENDERNGHVVRTVIQAAICRATQDTGVASLLDMIPAFSKLADNDGPVSMSTKQSSARPGFVSVCRLLRELCTTSKELFRIVIFIDDMQWLDAKSIELLNELICMEDMKNFMLLGTCRGVEVSDDSKLSVTLHSIESMGGNIIAIPLDDLSQTAIAQMIRDLLRIDEQLEMQDIRPLASFVMQLTSGNPFIATSFLRFLMDRKLIFRMDDGTWAWDEKDILDQKYTMDRKEISHADMLVNRVMSHNTETTTRILQVAAVLGSKFSLSQIHLVVEAHPTRLSLGMDRIVSKGLIVEIQDQAGQYRWAHDQFQQSAFSLIPKDEIGSFRYQVGRKLMEKLEPKDIVDNALLISGLLLNGNLEDESASVRTEVIGLFSVAGSIASQTTAFDEAAMYFRKGIELLPEDHWEQESMYDLSMNLYQCHAEMACCLGQNEIVDRRVDAILKNSRSMEDSVRAYDTLIYSLCSRNEMNESIKVGFNVLEMLGVKVPKNPGLTFNIRELVKTRLLLRKFSTDDILALPRLRKTNHQMILHAINVVFPAILRTKPEYCLFLVAKCVRLTLKNGLSPTSSLMFTALGMMLCNPLGMIEEGLRCGEIGRRLYEKFSSPHDMKCRMMVMQYAALRPWSEPATKCLDPLLAGADAGFMSGDIDMAVSSNNEYSYVGMLCGLPLTEHCTSIHNFVNRCSTLGFETLMPYLKGCLQLGLNLRGKADNVLVLSGQDFDAEETLRILEEKNNAQGITYIFLLKLFLAVFMNEFELAITIAQRLTRCNKESFGAFLLMYVQFLSSLSEAIVARETGRRSNVKASLKAFKKLKKFVRKSTNSWEGRFEMIMAEHDARNGMYDSAARKLTFAASYADSYGLIHEKALSLERLGRLQINHQGRTANGIESLHHAQEAYREWGCEPKCKMIESFIAIKEAERNSVP